MNKKIERVREDIRKTKARMRELEEYLKTLQMQERQLCDEEIAKTIREMSGKDCDVLETLRRIQQAQNEVREDVDLTGEEMEHND